MFSLVPTRFAVFTAFPIAIRQRVPRIGPSYLNKATENAIRVDAALGDHPTRDQHRRVPGGTGRIDSSETSNSPGETDAASETDFA